MTEEYVIFFRGTDWDRKLSPHELQGAMQSITSWLDNLQATGKMTGGKPLLSGGKEVRLGSVADGCFAEAKEAVGGFVSLQLESLEQAVEIASSWPGLELGGCCEVRQSLPECSMVAEMRRRENLQQGAGHAG